VNGGDCRSARVDMDVVGPSTVADRCRESDNSPRRQGHAPSAVARWVVAVALLCLGGLYALMVAPGLPYDEPSHWGYAQWLAVRGTLPQIGEQSVGYEAQMGPLGYLVPAAIVRLFSLLGGSPSLALVVARLAGLLVWTVSAYGMFRLIRLCLPMVPADAAVAGVALALANPMVFGMSLTIQNDTFALAAVIWLMVLAASPKQARPLRRGAAIGCLAGAAVLAKLVVLPAVVVTIAWWAWERRPHRLGDFLVASGLTVAICGWWFMRNVALYGDATGRAGIHDRLGLDFPPLDLPVAQAAMHLTRTAIAYLWLPGEYYRSALHTPPVLDVLMVFVTAAVLGGGACALRGRLTKHVLLVLTVAVASVLAWAWTAEFQQAVAFRTAYAALPAYGLLLAALSRYVRARVLIWAVTVIHACLHAWTLTTVFGIAYSPGVQL
jgi:hypothetical protein